MEKIELEDVEPEKIEQFLVFHEELNERLWNNKKLNSEVRFKLLKSAMIFYKFLDLPDLKIEDVILTGSNASYNYTPLSDLDVHIIVNYNTLGDLAENFFTTKKSLWNETHHIKIRGYGVELYVEDSNQPVTANGVYSLLENKWLKTPKQEEIHYDDAAVVTKTNYFVDEIDEILKNEPSLEDITAILDRLKNLRRAGLAAGGEFSVENLTFKSLRNLGYLDKLFDAKIRLQDAELSMESITEEVQRFVKVGDDIIMIEGFVSNIGSVLSLMNQNEYVDDAYYAAMDLVRFIKTSDKLCFVEKPEIKDDNKVEVRLRGFGEWANDVPTFDTFNSLKTIINKISSDFNVVVRFSIEENKWISISIEKVEE